MMVNTYLYNSIFYIYIYNDVGNHNLLAWVCNITPFLPTSWGCHLSTLSPWGWLNPHDTTCYFARWMHTFASLCLVAWQFFLDNTWKRANQACAWMNLSGHKFVGMMVLLWIVTPSMLSHCVVPTTSKDKISRIRPDLAGVAKSAYLNRFR